MSSFTLVSSDNFEAKKLNGVMFTFDGGAFSQNGWGIWDKSAEGWVSMKSEEITPGNTAPVPYCLRTQKAVKKACAQGLYEGYQVIKL